MQNNSLAIFRENRIGVLLAVININAINKSQLRWLSKKIYGQEIL